MRLIRPTLAVTLLLALGAAPSRADDGGDFFEAKIRPVLVEKCNRCHSADLSKKPKGGLRLGSVDGIRKGGDSGPVVVAGQVEESSLIAAIAQEDGVAAMPPDAKLPDRVINDFRQWVESGATMPASAETSGASKPSPAIDFEQGRRFWSFLPAVVQADPKVSDPSWSRSRLDGFILRKLDEKGIRPSPEADRRTLIRRVSFDLTGLPPTFDEVREFVADPAPDAYERLVDRLLGSPHYGERWGRHWLDVARYAEDNPTGEATNKPQKNPFTYRDWVIQAINEDLPYDQFVRRQLAADLIPGLPLSERSALGFLGLAPVYHKEPKLSADVITTIVADEWDERLDTISRGLLGLTVACARCHDHKFDPIGTADYYALAGVMASTQLVDRPLVEVEPEVADHIALDRARLVDLEQRLNYAREVKGTLVKKKEKTDEADERIKDLQEKVDEMKQVQAFAGPTTPAVRDAGLWVDGSDPSWTSLDYRPGEGRDLPIFVRGNPSNPGPVVPRRFVEVLSSGTPAPFGPGSGRKDLADRIVSDAGSLASRVIVNRVWGWHFGKSIVSTPSNFGKLGEMPSHPELLDDLAARFIADGWSLKKLNREIVLSATYRQSSTGDPAGRAVDPENKWLGRGGRVRLDVEAWRDAILRVSNGLEERMGGPSGDLERGDFRRRTVYGKIRRSRVADLLRLFDFPDANRHGEGRDQTTTPIQQLYFLNSPFLMGRASAMVGPIFDGQPSPDEFVVNLHRAILQRDPTDTEIARSLRLVEDEGGPESRDAWAILAQALLIGNEFLFVD